MEVSLRPALLGNVGVGCNAQSATVDPQNLRRIGHGTVVL